MSKILITGGAGYIGSVLATKLILLGHKVTVVDKLMYSTDSLNHLFFYENFQLIKKDIRDQSFNKKFFKKFQFIIPLAALVGAPICDKNKKLAVAINYNAILSMIKKIGKSQKIIFMNSNSGYGIGEKNKFCDEKSLLKPISLYGKTKAQAEIEVLKHKNSICYRLATVFGYSYRMRTDLLVNNFVYKAIKNNILKIFEPHFRRNFIHVSDVVEGIVFAIKNFSKMKGNVYNLGISSANITKLQLAKKIKKYYKNLRIKIIYGVKDPDQRDYFVSNRKIESLGFVARVSLDRGIKEMLYIFKNSRLRINNNY
jgi:nucleoside-diphosphate-sugar epimerase